MKHVLVLDRNQVTKLELAELMRQHDMRATHVTESDHLLGVLAREMVDALLIEIAIDEMVGVIGHLTGVTDAPILLVGPEKTIEEEKVRGLEAGATDYICKPVGNRELVARLKAAIRNKPASTLRQDRRSYTFSGYELFLRQRLLTHPEVGEIKLTTAEFNLLTVFLASPRMILTRARLLSASRLHEGEIVDRSLDALILRLRRKVEPNSAKPRLIRTVRGSGYLFDSEVAFELRNPPRR